MSESSYCELIGVVRDCLESDLIRSGSLDSVLFEILDKIKERKVSHEGLCVEFNPSVLDSDFYLFVDGVVKKRLEESFSIGKEVAGVIYKTINDDFFEALRVTGDKESVFILNGNKVDKLPDGIECLVEYHTHPFIDCLASPSHQDEKGSDCVQLSFDLYYSEKIPVFMVIAAPEGIKWYQSTLKYRFFVYN